jgi:LPS-assembly protein
MHWCRAVGVAAMISLLASFARAQDAPKPSLPAPQPSAPSAPLSMQADQLVFDTRGNRVVAQGNVEIYWSNHILTADQVVYDAAANTLVAEGNAQLKDPNGRITRADRFEAPDDFRDAFVQSLPMTDDTRTSAPPD